MLPHIWKRSGQASEGGQGDERRDTQGWTMVMMVVVEGIGERGSWLIGALADIILSGAIGVIPNMLGGCSLLVVRAKNSVCRPDKLQRHQDQQDQGDEFTHGVLL